MRFGVLLIAASVLAASGCREGDGPSDPGATDVRLHVVSDPAGASIELDDKATGRFTPDTLDLRSGEHSLRLRLDSAGFTYDYAAIFRISRSDSVATLFAPLALQCPVDLPAACYAASRRSHTAAGMRFTTTARGALFHWDGSGQGIFWPAAGINSYMASALPTFAASIGGQRVAIGPYDHAFFAGRPAPRIEQGGGQFRATHTSWMVPPFAAGRRFSTVRGIELVQEVIARDDVAQVFLVRLTFRNITDVPDLYDYAPYLSLAPVTYTDAYIGMILDPDIGQASDDWLSYDPALDMVYAYDARFAEPTFVGEASAAPGLVGLRALRIPAGTAVQLNGWTNRQGFAGDWTGGTDGEATGYGVLSGQASYLPEHSSPRIGHLPTASGDARITLTAGPLTLAPGQQAEIVLAIAIAAPAPGTFTFEQAVEPGDPSVTTRQLHAIAALLRDRMRAAEALLGS